MNFYILKGNETQGPFTFNQIKSLWKSGSVTTNSFYCREGDDKWCPILEIIKDLEDLKPEKSAKQRGIFIIIAILLGALGIHNFYAGYYSKGTKQLLITILGALIVIGPLVSFCWAIYDAVNTVNDSDGKIML